MELHEIITALTSTETRIDSKMSKIAMDVSGAIADTNSRVAELTGQHNKFVRTHNANMGAILEFSGGMNSRVTKLEKTVKSVDGANTALVIGFVALLYGAVIGGVLLSTAMDELSNRVNDLDDKVSGKEGGR